MDGTPPTEGGIFAGVTRLFQTLRDVAENRLELFLVEFKEERIRLFDALCLFAVGFACLLMALVMVTFTVVVIFWDTHRVLVLVLLMVAYAVVATAAMMKLRSRLLRWQAFSTTLEQIKKDRSCLEKPN